MKKVRIDVHKNNYWQVATITIDYDNNKQEEIIVNKFYEVDKDWIYIYDEIGGSGYGYKKGNLIHRIYIGDAEVETAETDNCMYENLEEEKFHRLPLTLEIETKDYSPENISAIKFNGIIYTKNNIK